MATSNSYTFYDTTQSIVYDSMMFLGYLGDNETPSDGDYSLAVRTLNRMTKSVMLKNDSSPGMKMWLRETGYCFLQSNAGQYTLSAKSQGWTNTFSDTNARGTNLVGQNTLVVVSTSGIQQNNAIGLLLDNNTLQWTTVANVVSGNTLTLANNLAFGMNGNGIVYSYANAALPPQVINWINLRDQNGNDVFVEILTYEEYEALPSKNSPIYQGDPVAVYYESHLVGGLGSGYGLLNTDVNGSIDLTKYLVVNYVREIQDWVNPADEPDFPKEWNLALVYNLAKHLSPSFNMNWTQLQDNLANEALATAKSANPLRLSYKFSRRGATGGTFRNIPHR